MLAEINLLPRKQPRNYTFLIALAVLALVVAGAASFLFWSWKSQTSKLADMNQQIQAQQEIRAAQELKMENLANSNSAVQLESTIDWAKNYEVKTVPVLQHVISLLPERGYILNFEFSDDGKITLGTQFDTSREAAYYLSELTSSEWLKEVKMITLSTTLGKFNALTGEDASDPDKNDDKQKLENSMFVPRYAAVYEFAINQEKAKKAAAKAEKNKNVPSSSQGGQN
ncbi:hypothetical protein [Peribacillus deserti]|uniref:Fimbrial assembly protein n=1 Tax=Peribacillus deserti TaxID=673318 RepID=A0A2N5M710_9BACI|nr:hypothetical protein [Peribacillus deserti]PLT30149.1 hypothetical protein CUU66_08890 [Peribacillus deserti]